MIGIALSGTRLAISAIAIPALLALLLSRPALATTRLDWSQRSPTTQPASRSRSGFAFDSSRNEAVLFGGIGSSTFSDTWVWNGSSWTQRSAGTLPPARSETAMAYDSARQLTVLFGGVSPGAASTA